LFAPTRSDRLAHIYLSSFQSLPPILFVFSYLLSFHIVVNSFATLKNLSPFFSSNSELLLQNTGVATPWNSNVPVGAFPSARTKRRFTSRIASGPSDGSPTRRDCMVFDANLHHFTDPHRGPSSGK
jgi:hypothetical protein